MTTRQTDGTVPKLRLEDALTSTILDKRIEVLREIDRLGSISEAARANDISYKAAWQAIETLSNLAGAPLVQKSVGGSGGGGARLTEAGKQLLKAADHLNQARARALTELQGEAATSQGAMARLASIGMRTSMRNQLPCVISEIARPDGAARVWLQLPDGQRLSSRITNESLELLDLKPGMPVLALFKATAVTIAPAIVAMGEVNVLKGKIGKRLGLKRDGQVSLTLGEGLHVAGFADPATPFKLKQQAMAAIAESALVIGLPG